MPKNTNILETENAEISSGLLENEVHRSILIAGNNGNTSLAKISDGFAKGTETIEVRGTVKTVSVSNKNIESSPVIRFFNQTDGTHFFTSNPGEANELSKSRSDLVLEAPAFLTAAQSDQNGFPIYRFFDTNNGTHFFTSNTNEKNDLLTTRADLTYEGADFYEHLDKQAGDVAVHRFFDQKTGTHFFTADTNEKETIASSQPNYTYEGIAFWSPHT